MFSANRSELGRYSSDIAIDDLYLEGEAFPTTTISVSTITTSTTKKSTITTIAPTTTTSISLNDTSNSTVSNITQSTPFYTSSSVQLNVTIMPFNITTSVEDDAISNEQLKSFYLKIFAILFSSFILLSIIGIVFCICRKVMRKKVRPTNEIMMSSHTQRNAVHPEIQNRYN